MIHEEIFHYWGKASNEIDGDTACHLLPYHSLDAAAVASAWWRADHSIRRAFQSASPLDEAVLKNWVLFFIALHDLGKFDFRFQRKSPQTAFSLWPGFNDAADDREYDHGRGGFCWFVSEAEDYGLDADGLEAAIPWARAVTGHHGRPPSGDYIQRATAREADHHVIAHDRKARALWIETLKSLFLAPLGLPLGADTIPSLSPDFASTFLAGFCSVCDWLGSNTEYFPYAGLPTGSLEAYFKDREKRARRALMESGLLEKPLSHGGFGALFPEHRPRGVQTVTDALPLEPGLTIIEAPTGSGKTEAALAYASRLLSDGEAESIIFALPTQATANAMLTRLENVAARLFPSGANVVLAHGKAAFNPGFIDLKRSAQPSTAQGETEALVQCARWLATSRKRVFLGQIGVCTIDQVLLSVLPVRHNFVRAFGVQKSVLIVDEVHAYDTYMYGLLSAVLQRQRCAGGSAVLLSATLPASTRRDFISSWGASHDDGEVAAYPLLTHASGEVRTYGLSPGDMPPGRVVSALLRPSAGLLPDKTFLDQVTAAAMRGAQVAVICNLVADAQKIYLDLVSKGNVPVRLFHSRFRFMDRQEIEEEVVRLYGKKGKRNGGSILVATQVIEQSLDLDFDWMVTQICPVDLLFQRLGRLHRHERTRPEGHETPRVTVLTHNGDGYGLHKLIYGNTRLLWRTEELLREHGEISFPGAYRKWIEDVYSEEPWPSEPEEIIRDAERFEEEKLASRYNARNLVESAVTPLPDTDDSAAALTRDGEMSLNVLLFTSIDGIKCLLDGTPFNKLGDWEREELINMNTVPAPASWRGGLPPPERQGGLRLEMRKTEDGWESVKAPKVFTYTEDMGLRKEDRDEPVDR